MLHYDYLLSVRRRLGHAVGGKTPAHTGNGLSADVTMGRCPTEGGKLTLRMFTMNYRFLASDTFTGKPKARQRKFHFELGSLAEWPTDGQLAILFRDDKPVAYNYLYLVSEEITSVRCKLASFEYAPREWFFASQLWSHTFWSDFNAVGCTSDEADCYIDMLLRINSYRKESNSLSPKAVTITGSYNYPWKLADCVLGSYLAEENGDDKFSTSLGELCLHRNLLDFVGESDVVTVCIDTPPHLDEARDVLHKLGLIAGNSNLGKKALIFYGTKESLDNAKSLSDTFAIALQDAESFSLPEDSYESTDSPSEDESDDDTTLDDDEFEKKLNEFTSGNDAPKDDGKSEAAEKRMSDELESIRRMLDEPTAEEQLRRMVGLNRVKEEIADARRMALFNKERRNFGLDTSSENRHHMLFLGNPGTGKTTVAKLIGRMYHDMGMLSKGHTVEVDRSKLVGEYIGETEKNMRAVISKARGGVLFVDEAYTLVNCADDTKDYGKQVLNTLLTVLSEPNPDLIIIFAGYEDKIMRLLKVNQGLLDRFPLKIHFEDYNAEQLLQIATDTLRRQNFTLTDAASRSLERLMQKAVAQRDCYFGNGRWVHNLVEQGLIRSLAKRVMNLPERNRQLLSTIEEQDVEEASRLFASNTTVLSRPERRIGFTA